MPEETFTEAANPTSVIWGFIRKQIPVVIIMAIGLWWMNSRWEEDKKQWALKEQKQDEQIDILNTYIRTEFKATLEENTRVLDKVNDKLRD